MSLVSYYDRVQRGHVYQDLDAVHTYLQGYQGQKRYAILYTLRDRFIERMP